MTIDLVISSIIIFSSLVSRSTYGCPTNDFANVWLWLPCINFTIHHSPPNTGFTHNLKGHPYFLLSVTIRTKSCLYALYFPLFSQLIKTYEIFPLFLLLVFDLIIITTKPISYAIEWAQCKTSSQVANTYKRVNTCLVFKGHYLL